MNRSIIFTLPSTEMSTQRKAQFKIHVDPSCLTNSTDLAMSPERNTSNTTIVRHDSWSESAEKDQELAANEDNDHVIDTEHEARERQIDRIEAQIQAAARAVVASIENDAYNGNEDSVLSMQTDESYEPEGTELTYDGTDMTYGSENASHEGDEEVGETEVTYASESGEEHNQTMDVSEMISDSGNEEVSELNQDIGISGMDYESDHENISQAEIEAENKDITSQEQIMQSIEHDDEEPKLEVVNELTPQSSKSLDEIKYDDVDNPEEVEPTSEHDRGGDSSSHHDGDIDDDVFSHNSSRSARSSLNSCEGLQSTEEKDNQRVLTSPSVGEEANTRRESDVISRIPSSGSYMHPIPDVAQQTPSKVLTRPPFRTPSSVRAIQMSSPTPSIYNSPRSIKRHLPTVSRIGTPTSHTSKTRTPTRFKPKKEQPLVLLHVTVLPLQWPYSHLMLAPELSDDLQYVKENWRLLQEKLADTVLERGILLPHPQDSFEVLEERLLEALDLPVRPRALILKCGHYMGPLDSEAPSSDDEGGSFWNENMTRRRWCDICRKEVRLDNGGELEGKRFRVKIFASNGLMHAGAWAAAWKEMERVDVEIGPWVEPYQHTELERLAMLKPQTMVEEHDDGFEDEEILQERDRLTHDDEAPHPEDNGQSHRGIDLDGISNVDASEPSLDSGAGDDAPESPEAPIEPEKSVADYENEMRELLREEEQMRELHERENTIPQRSPSPRRENSRPSINEDSLSELLVAAFKVAMRDQKNVAIVVLSILVLVLAFRLGTAPSTDVPTPASPATRPEVLGNITPVMNTDTVVSVATVISETLAVTSDAIVGTPMPVAMKPQKPLQASKQIRKASAKSKAKPRGSATVETAESSTPEMKEDPVSTATAEMGRNLPFKGDEALDKNLKHSLKPADEVAQSGNDESDSKSGHAENHTISTPSVAVPKMESKLDVQVDGKFKGESEEMEMKMEEEDAEDPLEATETEEELQYAPEVVTEKLVSLEDAIASDTIEDVDVDFEGEEEEPVVETSLLM
jgi:hypothetical protein